MALATMVAVSACALPAQVPVARPAIALPDESGIGTRSEFLPWAADEPWFVIVDRETREVVVLRYGWQVRQFPAVFGRVPGRKLYEGDKRTPSGVYRISRKREHSRFHRFLDIDYPTAADWRRYGAAVRRGEVPMNGSGPVGPGWLLGIHGSDAEILNRDGFDWTFGCVSLLNDHVEELYGLVPVGAPVLIRDDDPPS